MSGDPARGGDALADITAGEALNRQAKKLQLRRAGFKAKDLPSRNVTPRRKASWARRPSGSQWVAAMDMTETKPDSPVAGHNVLREISNSSRRVKKQSRARVDDSIFIYQDENVHESPKVTKIDSFMTDASPCRTPGSATKTMSSVKATPSNRLRKQSFSIDSHKYIEHLESELAAVQTQLAAMNSPTVLQAKSMKMRALNAETRALQDEVADWERKFRDRVQEEVEEHGKIETGLKSRIRRLEGDVEDYVLKIKELTAHIDQRKASEEAAESANMELERRIEAISNFVASPKRRPLERSNSSSVARHSRCKSTLPRFPTTGSLGAISRKSDGNPTTPKTFTANAGKSSQSENFRADRRSLRIDVNAEALAALTGEDDTSRPTPSDVPSSSSSSNRFTWATPDCYTSLESVAAASNGKPSRRMRKFHGRTEPKTLFLPSANSTRYGRPASVALLQTHQETPAKLPFPEFLELGAASNTRNFDLLLSPLPGNGRRRALTSIEDVASAMRRAKNPFASPIPWPAAMAKSSAAPSESSQTADAPDSDRTVGESASTDAGGPGRNLFDELQQAKNTLGSGEDVDDLTIDRISSNVTIGSTCSSSLRFDSPLHSNTSRLGLRKRAWTAHHRTLSDQTGISGLRRRDPEYDLTALEPSFDTRASEMSIARLDDQQAFGAVFRDACQQTYATARRTLIYAQSITIHSASVQRLQWWAIQILLGPQVSRRMMTNSMSADRRVRKRKRHEERAIRREQRRLSALHAAAGEANGSQLAVMSSAGDQDASSGSSCGSGSEQGGAHCRRGHRQHKRRKSGALVQSSSTPGQLVVHGTTTPWLSRHNPWLWIRFSLALLFAIGAAIRDGPGVVMGVAEEEEKIE